MLREEDKIFKNLYGFEEWSLVGAQKRGIWSNTKEIIEKSRENIAISFGSCSFQEPIDDLTQLGWM